MCFGWTFFVVSGWTSCACARTGEMQKIPITRKIKDAAHLKHTLKDVKGCCHTIIR